MFIYKCKLNWSEVAHDTHLFIYTHICVYVYSHIYICKQANTSKGYCQNSSSLEWRWTANVFNTLC